MSVRTFARLGAPAAVAALALGIPLGVAGPAAAHVTITPTSTAAGSYTVLTVAYGHGCDGSPTTEVAVQIPEGINAVSPTRHPFYTVEKVMEQLTEPIEDSHGNQITERVGQVVYTARTPLPEGQRDTFELSLQLPDAAGETLVFPAIQTCEEGENAWTQEVAEGGEEPEYPAPTMTVTEADADGGHGAAAEETSEESGEDAGEDTEPVAATTDADSDDEGSGTALGVAGLVAGLLGLAAGVTALVAGRRKA